MSGSLVGAVLLWGAVAMSAVSVLAGIIGRESLRWLRTAFVVAILANAVLVWLLISGDFANSYVALTTSRETPWIYRVAALWGGMDGSLLFYSTLILGFGVRANRLRPSRDGIVVASLIGLGYLALTALMASPFRISAIPGVDGDGLLGILQHPAMVYHPPILYLGLTTTVVPFVMALAVRRETMAPVAWVPALRRGVLVSWTFLTLGMVAGANWAYVELGWGGFWAWDPVENTSLMPWLAATGFLHVSRVTQRSGAMRRTAIALAMLPFALSLLGVYLTRSGITGSVHSFAESEAIGRLLFGSAVLGLAAVGWLATRATGESVFSEWWPFRREQWLMVGVVTVLIAVVFVSVGSAYPGYASLVHADQLTVGSRFFISTVGPVGLLMVVLGIAGSESTWVGKTAVWRPLAAFALLAALTGAVSSIWLEAGPGLGRVGLAIGGASVIWYLTRLTKKRDRTGLVMILGHLGFALVIAGAAGSAHGADSVGTLAVGDAMTVGPYEVQLMDLSGGTEGRFVYLRSEMEVTRDGKAVSTEYPEIRAYEGQSRPIAEPSLISSLSDDLVIAMNRAGPDASFVEVSLFWRPMVSLVWIGGLVLTLSGVLALWARSVSDVRRRRSAKARLPARGTTSGI